MVIDFHCHMFPPAVAAKALPLLSRASGIEPLTDGTVEGTLQKMAGWPVDKLVFLPVATQPQHQRGVNDYAAAMQRGDAYCFGTLHPQSPDALAELERLHALGLKGVKLHPQYQQTEIDDPACVALIRRAAQLGLPVIFHAGTDPAYALPWHASPERVARLLDQLADLPDVKLIAAHMGGLGLWDEAERHLLGREIYFDTSFVAGRMEPAQARRFIERQGSKRILFGSDCPWGSPREAYDWLLALDLPPDWLADILYHNAARLLKLTE